jgi:PAS domain S-box-containing protein
VPPRHVNHNLRWLIVALAFSLGDAVPVGAFQIWPPQSPPLELHTLLGTAPFWHNPWVIGLALLVLAAALAGVFVRFKCSRCAYIGRQQEIQAAIGAAQRRLAAILENTSDLVAFADAERKPLYVNSAGRRMLGLGPDEELADFSTNQMYPSWANDLILNEGLPTALREGVWRGQTAVRQRDGREIPVSQVITAHRKPDGTLDFTSTIIRDITPLVEAMRALESSRARFRSYWDSCPMGILAYELQADDRLIFVHANPAADRILGVDCQQFVGRTLEEAFPPLADTEIPEAYRRAAREGLSFHTDQMDYEHGQIRGLFEVYAFQTSPNCMACMFLEITVRRQAELALRESEDRFHQLALSIHEVFYLVDWPEPRFIYVSPAFESIWGTKPNVLYHEPSFWTALIHPDDQQRVATSLQEQIPTGEWTADYRILRPDNSVRWIRDRAFAIRDAFGNVHRLAGVAEDITERHQAETAEQTFRRLAQSLVGTLFLDDLGRYVAAACRTLFRHDAFFLELLDPESGERTPVYAEDTRPGVDTPEEVEPPTPDLSAEWLSRLQHGHTLIVNRSPDTEEAELGLWGFTERRTKSILLGPVVSGGRCIGLISLQSYTTDRYQSRDADLLQTLANQCAATLVRVQAEEQLRLLNSELESKIRDRTNELQRVVNLMAGRETRMGELKEEIQQLRTELQRARSTPTPDPEPDTHRRSPSSP